MNQHNMTEDHPAAAVEAPDLRRRSNRFTLTATVIVALLCAQPAYAYLDPGTGSIILQGLIAAVAATIAYAGMYWQRVKTFFSSMRHPKRPVQPEPDQSPKDSPP